MTVKKAADIGVVQLQFMEWRLGVKAGQAVSAHVSVWLPTPRSRSREISLRFEGTDYGVARVDLRNVERSFNLVAGYYGSDTRYTNVVDVPALLARVSAVQDPLVFRPYSGVTEHSRPWEAPPGSAPTAVDLPSEPMDWVLELRRTPAALELWGHRVLSSRWAPIWGAWALLGRTTVDVLVQERGRAITIQKGERAGDGHLSLHSDECPVFVLKSRADQEALLMWLDVQQGVGAVSGMFGGLMDRLVRR